MECLLLVQECWYNMWRYIGVLQSSPEPWGPDVDHLKVWISGVTNTRNSSVNRGNIPRGQKGHDTSSVEDFVRAEGSRKANNIPLFHTCKKSRKKAHKIGSVRNLNWFIGLLAKHLANCFDMFVKMIWNEWFRYAWSFLCLENLPVLV